MNVRLILAASTDWIIGDQNTIPWKMKDDMKFFKETTTGGVVIMGRKTYDSMGGKVLPKRMNVIITRDPVKWSEEYIEKAEKMDGNISVVGSLEEAIKEARGRPWVHAGQPKFDKSINIIGGAEIYRQALENGLVDEIFLTCVVDDHTVTGDTKFNLFDYTDRTEWDFEPIAIGTKDKNNQFPYVIHHYTKRK